MALAQLALTDLTRLASTTALMTRMASTIGPRGHRLRHRQIDNSGDSAGLAYTTLATQMAPATAQTSRLASITAETTWKESKRPT
jgi:hypothetical protein